MKTSRENISPECARPRAQQLCTEVPLGIIVNSQPVQVAAPGDGRTPSGSRPSTLAPRLRAFTLIEIMIVVAIMGLIAAMSVPTIYQISKKEGMRRAISDLKDVCSNARAQAIFSGKPTSVMFHPTERRFEVSGSSAPAATDPETGGERSAPGPAPGTGLTGIIPDDVTLEMLDVNMFEYKDSEWTVVRFSEMGTSDEMTIILRDADNKYRKLTLEPTTGLLLVGDLTRDLTR